MVLHNPIQGDTCEVEAEMIFGTKSQPGQDSKGLSVALEASETSCEVIEFHFG